MSFAEPRFLWLMLAAPLAALLLRAGEMTALRRIRRLDPARRDRGLASSLLPAGALLFLAIGLAGPRWGTRQATSLTPGADLVVLMDTSGSMLTRDVLPDRFSNSRLFVRDLLRRLPDTVRVALVRVEGEGEVISPLTLDRTAILGGLDELAVRGAAAPGSDLGDGLRKARALLSSRQTQFRSILFVSDGEDLDRNLHDAVNECGQANIVVDAVGVGTPAGGPVPAREGGFVSDLSGQSVISRAHPDSLAEIARQTGGVFIDLSNRSASPAGLIRSVAGLGRLREGATHREPVPRAAVPLTVSILLWSAALFPRRIDR
jgi:Ca-activated chloride channel family protein